ncbi:MAG TPA: 50S ribosomal protein L29 [Anaerolineales bacterium]|jgi:large subunit ribosomal protein L29
MKTAEIRDMSVEAILEELDKAREELMRMRFQQATGELTNHNLPKGMRRNIARLMTVLKEKNRAEAGAEGEA